MAKSKASKTHVTLRLTEKEAETLRDILSATMEFGGLKLFNQVDIGLRNLNAKKKQAETYFMEKQGK